MSEKRLKSKKPVHYIRQKGKVEFHGDFCDVKWYIWFDLFATKSFKILMAFVTIYLISCDKWLPVICHLIKNLLP